MSTERWRCLQCDLIYTADLSVNYGCPRCLRRFELRQHEGERTRRWYAARLMKRVILGRMRRKSK